MKYAGFAVLFLFLFFILFSAVSLAAFAATRSLYFGLSGADVTDLQKSLIKTGYLADRYATGYFGALTENAIKKFQCNKEIICAGSSASGYGVYGPRTQSAMATAIPASRQAFSSNGRPLTGPATGGFEISIIFQ